MPCRAPRAACGPLLPRGVTSRENSPAAISVGVGGRSSRYPMKEIDPRQRRGYAAAHLVHVVAATRYVRVVADQHQRAGCRQADRSRRGADCGWSRAPHGRSGGRPRKRIRRGFLRCPRNCCSRVSSSSPVAHLSCASLAARFTLCVSDDCRFGESRPVSRLPRGDESRAAESRAGRANRSRPSCRSQPRRPVAPHVRLTGSAASRSVHPCSTIAWRP